MSTDERLHARRRSELSPLIGHQAVETWMGEDHLTLRDLWPGTPQCSIVGINPSPPSVVRGHYYQGPVGRRQMSRLCEVGLFPFPDDGDSFDDAAVAHGIGFTDIVKRPSVGEKDLRPEELEYGRPLLLAKLQAAAIPLIICVFRHPVKALIGTYGTPGFQTQTTDWGAQIFRMPSPYAPIEEVATTMGELRSYLNSRSQH